MKKGMFTIVFAAVLGMALTGCSKDAKDAAYMKDFNVDEYVTLGEYKGIEVTVSSTEATEEQKEQYIQNDLAGLVTLESVEGRDEVQNGDVANIDYEGKKDGVAFEGGTAAGYDLGIGSGTFIPGFEEGIVGMKKGETKDITVTFPENYRTEDLAGQEVVFTVTVNDIKEYKFPEITDELVASLGREDVTTAEEYDNFVENAIKEQLEASNDSQVLSEVLLKLEETSTIEDAPEAMVNRIYDTSMSKFSSWANSNGVEVSLYVSYVLGGTQEEYEQTVRDFAQRTAKQYMELAAVAKKEGLTVTDEEVEEDLKQQLGDEASQEDLETAKANMDIEAYKEDMLVMKVCDFLTEKANVSVEE